MISKILVPTDGSKAAQKTARYAVDLAKQLKASVIILSVIDKRSLIGQTVLAEDVNHHRTPVHDHTFAERNPIRVRVLPQVPVLESCARRV